MPKAKIDKKRCKGCQLCIMACPKKNLKRAEQHNDAGIFTVDVIAEEDCSGCGFCFIMCPDLAIEIE